MNISDEIRQRIGNDHRMASLILGFLADAADNMPTMPVRSSMRMALSQLPEDVTAAQKMAEAYLAGTPVTINRGKRSA